MAEPLYPSSQPTLHHLLSVLSQVSCCESERLQALTQLNRLCRSNAHDCVTTDNDALLLPQVLLELLRKSVNFEVVNLCITIINQKQLIAGVMPLVDVALGSGIAIFDEAEGNIRLASEAGVRLRCQAIKTLGRLGDDRALIPLMSLLNDKDTNYRIRLDAAESLGRLGDKNAVQPLIQIMKDDRESSLYLKESAIKALGMLGDIRALEPLLDMLESKRGFKQKFQFVAEQVLLAFGKIGSNGNHKVDEALLKALEDEASAVRLAATESVGQLGDSKYLPHLQARLFDASMEVAQCALAGIYKLGDTEALRSVLALENLPSYLREEILDFLLEVEPQNELLVDDLDQSEERDSP